MGKIFDALKKSQGNETRTSSSIAAPKKMVKTTPETIDALRLETITPEVPSEISPPPQTGMDPRPMSFLQQDPVASECFKLLRAKILTNDSGSRPRTIMVTSPEPLDGKTTVAANLAINIAQGINEHVMLVDCDLRRPSMNKFFGLNAHEGIREYLETGTSVAPYLIKTPVKKLTLLTAGKPPSNPSELLSSKKMRTLVEELKARYEDRYIIFDVPPSEFNAEVTFLAPMMDTVLLVVRSGKTDRDLLLKTVENIGAQRIFGIVFNASIELPKAYRHYCRYYAKP